MATCTYPDGYVEECTLADKYAYPLFETVDQSALAAIVKESTLIVPWAGSVHLLALALLGGAVFLTDMRVLGVGVRSMEPATMQRAMRPWLIAAILIMFASGITLALGEMMKLYYSPPYWMKMAALASALVFTFGVRDRLVSGKRAGILTWLLAAAALATWFGVFVMLTNTLARAFMAGLILLLALLAWIGAKHGAPGPARWTSAATIALWLTVAASGRWIAFY